MSGLLKLKITFEEYQEMIRYTLETTNKECIDPDYVELYTEFACELYGIQKEFDMQIIHLPDDPESIIGVIVIFNPDVIPNIPDRLNIFNFLKRRDYPNVPLEDKDSLST